MHRIVESLAHSRPGDPFAFGVFFSSGNGPLPLIATSESEPHTVGSFTAPPDGRATRAHMVAQVFVGR